MQNTELNFDHIIDLSDLKAAIGNVMGTGAISIWNPGDERAEHDIIITAGYPGGEFPLQVSVTDMHASEPLSISQVREIGRQLHSLILTDAIDTGIAPLYDDGYTMVSPDGSVDVLRARTDALDVGQLNLTPESRQRYVLALGHLSHAAAD